MVRDKEEPNRDALLVEYQKAQDSAEHHDNLVWIVSSIILGGMLVLIGFSLNYLNKPDLEFLLQYISILGITLTVFLWVFQSSFRNIKRQKYQRCKDIEIKLKMEQHCKLKYSGIQTILFRFILILFVLLWVLILPKTLG